MVLRANANSIKSSGGLLAKRVRRVLRKTSELGLQASLWRQDSSDLGAWTPFDSGVGIAARSESRSALRPEAKSQVRRAE